MPSIEFVQAAGNTRAGSSPVTATFGASTAAGNLLVAAYASFDNPAPVIVPITLTDTPGNTWVQLGASYADVSAPAQYVRLFYCLTSLAGATGVTANSTGSAAVQSSLVMAEFTRPSTLIQYAMEGHPFNVVSPGTNIPGATLTLPGPGLMIDVMQSNRSDMANDVGTTFVALPDQDGTGIDMVWAYAINPQRAAQQTFSRIVAGTVRGCVLSMSFLDTAGFAARPMPLGGKGASW